MPSEPSLRRLGVGGGGGGDRPLRAQLVVAIVVVLVILAVPLYLLRRPSGHENAPADAGASASALAALPAGSSAAFKDAGAEDDRVKLGPIQRVKCSASRKAAGQEGNLCDRLEVFENALSKAIRDNVGCAPKIAKGGNINFVLTVDFTDRRIHVFPGASGAWKGPSARKAADCVKRSLPAPDWTGLQHQYRFYMLAILATYPPVSADKPAGPAPSAGAPLFE